MDLFDIDFHIFTVIKFLFNLGVRFKYIYVHIKQPNDDDDENSSYEY